MMLASPAGAVRSWQARSSSLELPEAHGRLGFLVFNALLSLPGTARAEISVWRETARLGMGASGMSHAHNGALLLTYFKMFVGDRDGAAFRDRVSARYNEGTLGRILASSPDVVARRAAVLALGILGSFQESNAVLGNALRDNDASVRSMAEDALWAIWFRAGSPEQNRMLSQVRRSISRQQLEQAQRAGRSPDRGRARLHRGLQPAHHHLRPGGAVCRKRARLPERVRPQSLSFRCDLGHGAVPAPAQSPARRAQDPAPRLEAAAVPRDAPRRHSAPRNAARIRRQSLMD